MHKSRAVFSWGSGIKGKLGTGESISALKKITLLNALKGLGPISISNGSLHSAVICNEGRDVYIWGNGDKGQLGRGDTESQTFPRLVISLRDKQIIKICCGQAHTLALSSPGIIYSFGDNSHGQLGLGDQIKMVNIPEQIDSSYWNKTQIVNISCGHLVSAAINDNGDLFIWFFKK